MGGLFGGGSKKSGDRSTTPTSSSTADTIEMRNGTIYDKRGSTTPAATDVAANITDPAGSAAASKPSVSLLETILPSKTAKTPSKKSTLATPNYGFG